MIVSRVLSHKSGSWFEVSVQWVIAGLTISSGAGGILPRERLFGSCRNGALVRDVVLPNSDGAVGLDHSPKA